MGGEVKKKERQGPITWAGHPLYATFNPERSSEDKSEDSRHGLEAHVVPSSDQRTI